MWSPAFIDLFPQCIENSFLGNHFRRTCFWFSRALKRPWHSYTYAQSLTAFFPLLPFHFVSHKAVLPGKGLWCVKSETGLIPVSSVHKRVQLCIQNLRKCVRLRERERKERREERGREGERERERERAQLCIQSSSKLTSGPSWCFSWKQFF